MVFFVQGAAPLTSSFVPSLSPFFEWQPSRPRGSPLPLLPRPLPQRRLPASRPPCARSAAAPPAPARRRDRRRGARPASRTRSHLPAEVGAEATTSRPQQLLLPPPATGSSTSSRPSTHLPHPCPRRPKWDLWRNTGGFGRNPSTTRRRSGRRWPKKSFSGRRSGTTCLPGE